MTTNIEFTQHDGRRKTAGVDRMKKLRHGNPMNHVSMHIGLVGARVRLATVIEQRSRDEGSWTSSRSCVETYSCRRDRLLFIGTEPVGGQRPLKSVTQWGYRCWCIHRGPLSLEEGQRSHAPATYHQHDMLVGWDGWATEHTHFKPCSVPQWFD